jgi:hypothetical protein
VAYVRTVKTSSGATAVQVVWSSRRGSRKIEHLGSAHDEAGVALLKAAAAQRLAAGQTQLDLGLAQRSATEPLPITSSKSALLWEALCAAYEHIGFAEVVGEDEAFRQLVLARIIEPTSKADSLRVIEETGVAPVSYLNAVIDPERRVDWQARRADRRGADRRRADRDELELRVFET